MVTITPGDEAVLWHLLAFFGIVSVAAALLGFWLGRMFYRWRLKRAQDRIETLKLEVAMQNPRRAVWLCVMGALLLCVGCSKAPDVEQLSSSDHRWQEWGDANFGLGAACETIAIIKHGRNPSSPEEAQEWAKTEKLLLSK